jgi:serine/threonine-protein kinase RsbW
MLKKGFEINDDIYGNIMISVTECISNAIIHGNQSDKNKLVTSSSKWKMTN